MSTISAGAWGAARVLAGPPARGARRPSWGEVVRQVLLFGAGLVVYFGVRGLTQSDAATAEAHARELIQLEKDAGIWVEPVVQRWVLPHDWLVDLANWVYIWGHWPVIFAVLTWLLLRRPNAYYRVRNAFLISGLVGATIFVLYPVAPPRLMPDLGLLDTVTMQSRAYRVLQPPAFVNQYAALPSLHVGWDLLIGLTLYQQARARLLRWAGAVMPALMVAAVVLTANHYLVDAVLGATIALVGWRLALVLRESAVRASDPADAVAPAR